MMNWRDRKKNRKILFGLLLVLLVSSLLTLDCQAEPEFPPVFSYEAHKPVLEMSPYSRFLGPIGEYSCWEEDGVEHRLIAVRPLWSMEEADSYWAMDIIWPLSVWRDSWFFDFKWVLLYYSSTSKLTGASRYYVIPIWFSGEREDNGEFYWGLFPVYGEVYDLIGYDRIFWTLFPLYWDTEKNGTTGWGVLWPIINHDSGPRSDKLRIFPFYAHNHLYNEYYQESWLWPIFHRSKSMNPNIPGKGWMVWPLLGHNRYRDYNSWSSIWPLFQWTFKGNDGLAMNIVWPVFQYADNIEHTGDYKFYIFPLLGRSEIQDSTYYFFLWPLGTYMEDRGTDKKIQWLWILPLYWTKTVWNREDGRKLELYRRFWPFASYYKDDKVCELKILDIWPLRNMRVVERNWDPLLTFSDYIETDDGYNYDLFWGMFNCSSSLKHGKCLAIFPFYTVRYELKKSPFKIEHREKSCGGGESSEAIGSQVIRVKLDEVLAEPETIRDFFCGFVRESVDRDGESRWRLFWFWDI